MGEVLAQISDVLTAKWPEILAILTSTGFTYYVLKLIVSLIVTRVQNKTKEKFSKPILAEMEKVKNSQEQIKEEIKQLLIEHNAESDNRIKKAFEEEAERKALAYEEVLNEQLPVKEEEIKENVVEVVEAENVEEILEEQVVEEQPEPIQEQKVIAKRVIVND